jgi:hypothetical protein
MNGPFCMLLSVAKLLGGTRGTRGASGGGGQSVSAHSRLHTTCLGRELARALPADPHKLRTVRCRRVKADLVETQRPEGPALDAGHVPNSNHSQPRP